MFIGVAFATELKRFSEHAHLREWRAQLVRDRGDEVAPRPHKRTFALELEDDGAQQEEREDGEQHVEADRLWEPGDREMCHRSLRSVETLTHALHEVRM